MDVDLTNYATKAGELILEYAPRFLLALVVLIAGFWIAGRLKKVMNKGLAKGQMEPALQTFFTDIVNLLIKALVIISAASMVGVETTSFVALLGAAGLAVGLALQGSLGNFAGGVLILIFKPFRVHDLIDAQGFLGHVTGVNLFVTTLRTLDSRTVIVPNGPLAGDNITNLSTIGYLRVDMVIGISYNANLKQAKEIVMRILQEEEKVLKDPAPSVNVIELADSSVNLAVRPFAVTADYWPVQFRITEKVKLAFDEAGIEIPFPQRVVTHLNAIPTQPSV
jgi:small conductance mechanosensitive channel